MVGEMPTAPLRTTVGSAVFNPRNVKDLAGAIPMARILEHLGFTINEKRHRATCLLHGGSNPTSFAWREDGHWHCFSCGARGDRIDLIRAARQCTFREAVKFLAVLAGIRFSSVSSFRNKRGDLGPLERIEHAAWRVADIAAQLRRYYRDNLLRAECLQKQIGDEVMLARTVAQRERGWKHLERLADVSTCFLAGWSFINNAKPSALARFTLASACERRLIMRGKI